MTAWHSFLREVWMRSEGKVGEVGTGVHQEMLLSATFVAQRQALHLQLLQLRTYCGFRPFALDPVSPILFPVMSSIHPHSYSFLHLSPDFLLFPLASCTLCIAPFGLFCSFLLMFFFFFKLSFK